MSLGCKMILKEAKESSVVAIVRYVCSGVSDCMLVNAGGEGVKDMEIGGDFETAMRKESGRSW